MDKYEKFQNTLQDAAKKYTTLSKDEVIRVISHLDADGLSSAAIMLKTLDRDNRRYSLSTVHQLDEKIIKQIAAEPYNTVFFTDIGSGQLRLINKYLSKKTVFILDHHQVETEHNESIIHVNPHLCDINGSNEISGSGVTYLFSKAVNQLNTELAHVAILGAVGDVQENRGFERLNSEILKDATTEGNIKVITGLRLFGAQTKPLHKLLQYSTEFVIPGVTGDETAAIAFLQKLGIGIRTEQGFVRLVDLSEEELQRLVTAIILKRLDEKHPEDILGPVYIFPKEKKESPFRDAKEFATLLNACGRLGKSSIGIGACVGDSAMKEKAIRTLVAYKREISNALQWYRTTNKIIKGNGYLIINAEDKIRPTIIGTLASIISKSSVNSGTLVLSMAQMIDGKTKISFRVSGTHDINLRDIINRIVEPIEGQAGGHHQAAGALIDTDKEPQFIEAAKKILEAQALEQRIV